jgi:hypothetical protein
MRLGLMAAATLLAIAPGTGFAQRQTPIQLADGKPYEHKPSGLTVPATLDDLPRTGASALEAGQLDENVSFQSGNEVLTVYIFRNVTGSVPLWFDRASWMIEHRSDQYGAATPLDRPAAFVPPGQATASGLTRTWLTGKGPFRSTGVALVPLGGDWYVKLRYSSGTHSAEALAPRLAGAVAALGWPAAIAPQPAAALVAACTGSLDYARKAKLKKPDMTDALIGAMVAGAAREKAAKNPEEGLPVQWCREGDSTMQFGIYRAAGNNDGYLLALGDAGRAISVHRGLALEDRDPGYQVSVATLDRTLIYPSFDKLPRPEAAVEAVMRNRPISSSARDSKQLTIGIAK